MIRIFRKISNLFYIIRFLFNKITPKTVLLIEINDYHTELLPSFVHYLKKLDYNVEIMANYGQIGNLPHLDAKNIYHFTLSGFKKVLASNKIKNYSFLIFLSNEIYWSYNGEIKPDVNVLEKFSPKNKNIGAVIHDLGEKMPPSGVKKIVLADFLKEKSASFLSPDDFYTINPCYFIKEDKEKEKNQDKTIFITVGKLENIRKNSDLLFNAIRKLLNKRGSKDFEVRIIGNNSPDMVPNDLKDKIKVLGKLNFKRMYQELKQADFFLPLLDFNNKKHLRYIETGTSGSFQLIRGFSLPPVIEENFCTPHGFSKNNAIIYKEDFKGALEKCIDMKNDEYIKLSRALSKETDEIISASVLELKKMLGKNI